MLSSQTEVGSINQAVSQMSPHPYGLFQLAVLVVLNSDVKLTTTEVCHISQHVSQMRSHVCRILTSISSCSELRC